PREDPPRPQFVPPGCGKGPGITLSRTRYQPERTEMKTSYALIIALAMPASLIAQTPGTPPANPDTTTADSVKATWPKATLIAKLKESFAFCQSALDQLDDAKLADQITLTMGGTSRSLPRVQMVLGHALDLADH